MRCRIQIERDYGLVVAAALRSEARAGGFSQQAFPSDALSGLASDRKEPVKDTVSPCCAVPEPSAASTVWTRVASHPETKKDTTAAIRTGFGTGKMELRAFTRASMATGGPRSNPSH
jgi:hypothetical protein